MIKIIFKYYAICSAIVLTWVIFSFFISEQFIDPSATISNQTDKVRFLTYKDDFGMKTVMVAPGVTRKIKPITDSRYSLWVTPQLPVPDCGKINDCQQISWEKGKSFVVKKGIDGGIVFIKKH